MTSSERCQEKWPLFLAEMVGSDQSAIGIPFKMGMHAEKEIGAANLRPFFLSVYYLTPAGRESTDGQIEGSRPRQGCG